MKKNMRKWWSAGLSAALLLSSVPAWPVTSQAEETIVLEAENYTSSSGTVKKMDNSSASSGKYVGDFDALDSLSYQINVEKAGNYKVVLRAATERSEGKVLVNSGGFISKEAEIPNTGGWQSYQNVELKVWLEAGSQIVTVSNMNSTWNVDKLTFSYLDSEKTGEGTVAYESVYLDNRWKSQRVIEREAGVQYADRSDSDYADKATQWKLSPDEKGWYTIQNVATGNYLVMTEGTQVVSAASDGDTLEAGKWQIGDVGTYRVFYNKKYGKCGLNVEHQTEYPNQVLATEDTMIKWYSAQWKINVPAQQHKYTISGNKIEGTVGTAVSEDGKSITTTQGNSVRTWTLGQNNGPDISQAPVFKAEEMPIMEAIYNLSLEESLWNIHDGKYGDVFWTGTNWHKVWTRDTAMSVQYSLAWVFPEETKNSILEKVIGGKETPQVWEQDTGTGGSYPNSVDRIIMELAGWELYKTTGDKEFLEQIYQITANTLEQDYHVAYDEHSGLFMGETGGLDHRSKTYPDWMDEGEEDSIVNIAESKAANANIIFAEALRLMAKSAEILGKEESEITQWKEKYADLKQAINDRLWLENRGMYASWEYPEYMGSPVSDKVDVIANGYALMSDVASEQQKKEIMENYPLVVYGANTVWPQKNGKQASTVYHNRGVWPGWEASMMIGAKENGNLQLAEEIFKSCVRGAGMSLTNKEVINSSTGEGCWSDRQLWSIAGTLAGYYRVLFGMEYGEEGISFAPYIPDWMEGSCSLSNYKYRNAVLNLTVSGKGDTLESITVNGEKMPLDYILPADAEGTYNIILEVSDSKNRSKIHLEEDSWAVCPDLPVLTKDDDGALTWEENPKYTYKLWNGKEYLEVSGGSYYPPEDVYGVYSLVAVDKNGITSEMSKPITISPEGSVFLYEAEDGEYEEGNLQSSATGYTGTGYVVDFLTDRTNLKITADVPETGEYQLSMIYNNHGDPTSGQDCGIRSVYVDGVDAGTLVFPIVRYDFQKSSHLILSLAKGSHTIEIRYNDDDWYDTNMTTIAGSYKKNSVSYDSLTLEYLGQDSDEIKTAVEAAQAAREAQAVAEKAKREAKAAKKAAEIAKNEAEKAKTDAETAKNNAVTAETNAKTAQDKAEAAKAEAEKAKKAAADAAETAGENSEAALEAKNAAVAAQTAAEEAQRLAETAQDKAETAKTAAEAAQVKASESQTAAEMAQGKAETAQGKAETAANAAETAQTAAESAKSGAEGARDQALTAANEAKAAQTAAEDASKEAVNAKTEAVQAADGARTAKTEAETAQKAAEAVQTAVEKQLQLAQAETKAAEAFADRAEAAALAAEAAQKKAEQAQEAAEAARKEAQEKLAAAEKLQAELKSMLEAEHFRNEKVSLKKMKVQKRKAKVTWTAMDGADGYEVQYALRSSFKKAKKLNVTGKTTVSLKRLKSRKTYFVRVRAYRNVNGEKICTKYSTKKKVRVK